MVVRRDDVIASLCLSAQLERTVAEHLVHIHVDGRACAALNRVDGELVDQFPCDDLIRRAYEEIADLVRETACVHVRKRRSLLYLCECLDEIGIELLSRDVEVLDGTHRLHAVVDIIGHFQIAEKIVFNSHGVLSFI